MKPAVRLLCLWAALWGAAGTPGSAEAFTYSAGIRESYSDYGRNDYASDAASKLKMTLSELGFTSITLQTRIAAPSAAPGAVYVPRLGTRKNELEIMISRIFHGGGVPVLKPMVFVKPEVGAPVAVPALADPGSRDLFTSYAQLIGTFVSTLSSRPVDEFVLGSGMGAFLTLAYAPRWKALAGLLKMRAMDTTRISLDLMDEAALRNLEAMQQRDPAGFADTWGSIGRVRFALPVSDWLDSGTLAFKRDVFLGLLQDRISRLSRVLPSRKLVLSDLFVPACAGFRAAGPEVDCGGKKGDWSKQASLLREVLDALAALPPELAGALSTVELMTGSTQDEPLEDEADPRFLVFNAGARALLSERLARNVHHSESVASPARAGFRLFSVNDGKKHACIYFDEAGEQDLLGPIHAQLIDNLVGAFPGWLKERRRVSAYVPGDLDACDAVFYLASNFSTGAPSGFYPDLSEFLQRHPVAWFNYKFDSFLDYYLQQRFKSGWDSILFNVPKILQADRPPTEQDPDPGFYRYFHYKGETFEKMARFDPATRIFAASPEINAVAVSDPERVKVLSSAEHSRNHSLIPYVVEQDLRRGGKLFYFADLPFTFNHYEDRSLIFTDLIYDILNEPAPDRPLLAFVRLEDICPAIPEEYIAQSVDYLADRSIPFAMALIPYYSNLFSNPAGSPTAPVWLPADRFPDFAGMIRYAVARGAAFVMHGLAHQAGDLISGFNGGTGSDYEFWSWPGDRPHPDDSAEWAVSRLEMGEAVFRRMGLKASAWETPHYAASALDSFIFGRFFEWNYHRSLYFKSAVEQAGELASQPDFHGCADESCRELRRRSLSSLKVHADYTAFGGLVIPYPVFEDSYGQAVIPETIGMVDFPLYRSGTWRPVSRVEDLLRRAKKLRVIRGAMASFFWHPLLLDPKGAYYLEVPGSFDSIGGIHTLERLVQGLQELGYQFASITDCRYFPRKNCGT